MVTKKITIKIPSGLDARPAALLVQVASQYESSIYIECEEKKINAKSIMGMMSLALVNGKEVLLDVEGEDEQEAMEALVKFLSK